MAMAEANWSELPTELLNLISQRINNDLDLIRFRSVCHNWRTSSISYHHHHTLPFNLPHFISHYPLCSLSKHIIVLIKSPQKQDQETLQPWLIKISKNSNGETQLVHPLHDNLNIYRFPYDLDFNKLSVVHLGNHFVMHDYREGSTNIQKAGFGKKVVAVTCHGKKPLALFTLNFEGHPVLFNCRKERWTVITYMSTLFQDICVFKERFCAVNKIGLTVAFGPYYTDLVAENVDGGYMKFLVESEGELFLVDIYDRHCFGFPGEDGLRLNVFRLDEKEKRWVKVTNLGDRVLFLGNGCSFSTSVSKGGNCVIFIDDAFLPSDNMYCGRSVFHLDHGRLSRLSDYPHYFELLQCFK
ncbi:hypothetical protein TSUD_00610 [Trifolium subterraneum]|nr:hypothetical protein TSUD_00610 [Trifolium subterraneum]